MNTATLRCMRSQTLPRACVTAAHACHAEGSMILGSCFEAESNEHLPKQVLAFSGRRN